MQEANAFYFIQVHASCCKKDTWEVENSKLPEYLPTYKLCKMRVSFGQVKFNLQQKIANNTQGRKQLHTFHS